MFYETINNYSIWKFCSMFYETFIQYSVSKFCLLFLFNLEVWRIYIHYFKCSKSKCSLFIFAFKPLFSIHYSASIAFSRFQGLFKQESRGHHWVFFGLSYPSLVTGMWFLRNWGFRHLMGRVMGHSCRTSCTQDCFRMVTRFQVKLKDSLFIKWKKPHLNQQVKHLNLTLFL